MKHLTAVFIITACLSDPLHCCDSDSAGTPRISLSNLDRAYKTIDQLNEVLLSNDSENLLRVRLEHLATELAFNYAAAWGYGPQDMPLKTLNTSYQGLLQNLSIENSGPLDEAFFDKFYLPQDPETQVRILEDSESKGLIYGLVEGVTVEPCHDPDYPGFNINIELSSLMQPSPNSAIYRGYLNTKSGAKLHYLDFPDAPDAIRFVGPGGKYFEIQLHKTLRRSRLTKEAVEKAFKKFLKPASKKGLTNFGPIVDTNAPTSLELKADIRQTAEFYSLSYSYCFEPYEKSSIGLVTLQSLSQVWHVPVDYAARQSRTIEIIPGFDATFSQDFQFDHDHPAAVFEIQNSITPSKYVLASSINWDVLELGSAIDFGKKYITEFFDILRGDNWDSVAKTAQFFIPLMLENLKILQGLSKSIPTLKALASFLLTSQATRSEETFQLISFDEKWPRPESVKKTSDFADSKKN